MNFRTVFSKADLSQYNRTNNIVGLLRSIADYDPTSCSHREIQAMKKKSSVAVRVPVGTERKSLINFQMTA
jgi:hypothetical protein